SIIYGITRNVVSVKSVPSIVPKFPSITRIRSKLGMPLNGASSFPAKTDLNSFISVTKTQEVRISIVGTSAGSNSTVLNNSDLDEIDLDDSKIQ
ncbi:18391_t:CDS:1, partial [Racocetra fulgida]